MNLLKALKWRYATKRMNGERVPQEKFDNILEAIRLAPSSLGLQSYTVIVVESDEMKKRISEKACIQPQIMEGSHLVVFAAWDNVSAKNVETYIDNVSKTRGVDVSDLLDYKNLINGFLIKAGKDGLNRWAARQTYIALGIGLVSAATEGVDATPIEGFDNAVLDEVLGLKEKGLSSVVMMALGYRDEEKDLSAKAAKVRRSKTDLFIYR